jgi:hypothetical protein
VVTDRHSNSPEDAIVDRAIADLAAYLTRLDRSWIYPLLLYFSLGLFCLLIIGGGFYLDLEKRGIGSQYFEAMRTASHEWAIYSDPYGPSRFIGVFWFITVYWTIWITVGLLWRDFGVYAALKSEERKKPVLVFLDRYAAEVEAEIRSGKVRQFSAFKPSRIVGRTVLRHALICFPLSLVLTVAFAGFWYLDRMDYRLLSERGIEYTDYWTSAVHRSGYFTVSDVRVTCRGKNKDKLILRYEVEFDGANSAMVAEFTYPRQYRERLAGHLRNWKRVDGAVRSAGARFVYPVFNSIVISNRQEFNEAQCRNGIDALVGEDLRRQAMAILIGPQTPAGKAVQ